MKVDPRQLRVAEAVRLLNSTPLGEVVQPHVVCTGGSPLAGMPRCVASRAPASPPVAKPVSCNASIRRQVLWA